MEEIIDIYDGKGVLHLVGGTCETILYIKKEPVLFSFFAEINTTWRYYMGRKITAEIITSNYHYENLVRTGILANSPLSAQFRHLTNLLTNGQYRLSYCEVPYQWGITLAISSTENTVSSTYGGLAEVISTQVHLDRQVIEIYKREIRSGARPIVVLYKLEESWTTFVIDGHHKLHAYKESGINPKVLMISKLNHAEPELNKAIELMQTLGLNENAIIDIYKDEKINRSYERHYYYLKNNYSNNHFQ